MITIATTTSPEALQQYLHAKGWLHPNEKVLHLRKPGEGNMNVVLRITTDQRSFILKQSRPYVQKYQDIPAPLDRIHVEQLFYKAIHSDAISPYVPSILHYDAKDHILLLQDLGECEDMTSLYQQRSISDEALQQLTHILYLVHASTVPKDFPENKILRTLNHQHIFVLPFEEENGFNLDAIQPGLQDLSLLYKQDDKLKTQINRIGKHYLSSGNVLLHGDYYPGSWMMVNDHTFVIDPEFSFVGFPEFDLGVLAGHLIMVTSKNQILSSIVHQYPKNINIQLMQQIAGIEIMRRLIGLAQLPLERSLSEKATLLQLAHKMILS